MKDLTPLALTPLALKDLTPLDDPFAPCTRQDVSRYLHANLFSSPVVSLALA